MVKGEIREKNKVIARFMGFKRSGELPYIEYSAHGVKGLEWYAKQNNGRRQGSWVSDDSGEMGMEFHSDWNWLMPVLDKIEEIGETVNSYGTLITISTTYIEIGHVLRDRKIISSLYWKGKLEETYIAVVEFILTYKDQISSKGT